MIKSILYSAVAGIVGTALGGILGALLSKRKFLGAAASLFSGGFMLALVSFELIPEAITHGSVLSSAICFSVGVAFVILINALFTKNNKHKNKDYLSGMLIFAAIAAHNFPEGLAIGGGEAAGIGLTIAVLIAIHNIPEGMAMTIPLTRGEMSKRKAITLSVISGLPMCLGGFVGSLASSFSSSLSAACLSLAAGSMAYVTFADILPLSVVEDTKTSELLALPLGFLIGMILCNVI